MRTTRTLLLCAWILWGFGADNGGMQGFVAIPRYHTWGAYTSMAECQSALKGWKMPQSYTRAVCLPDTVNPNAK